MEQYGKQRKNANRELPKKGLPQAEVTKIVAGREEEARHCWTEAKVSGCVYTDDQKHWDFVNDAMKRYVMTNPLHMDEFKMITKWEAEIIRMVCTLYNGDDKSCGLLSSGGTESIILACLAYREKALERGVT